MVQQPNFVDVAGNRTRYFMAGQGEPLLLIHDSTFGEPSNAENWEPVIGPLSQHFRVYAPDKLGQGHTDNPTADEDYVIGSSVTHIADFARTLGFERIHVVGHSRGGYNACRLAMEYPELVRTVVIVDSGTLVGNDGAFYERLEVQLADIHDASEHYRYMERVHSWRGAHITDGWIRGMVEIHNLPKMRIAAEKMGWGEFSGGGSPYRVTTAIGRRFFSDLAERRRETHEWIRQGRLVVPTLVVWGYNDPSALFDTIGVATMRLVFPHVPRAEMHILNEAGHHCYREQPHGFAAAVTGFIKPGRT